jgi:hypothetical protein
MRLLLVIVTCYILVGNEIFGLPVTQKATKDEDDKDKDVPHEDIENTLEYERYLKEVVSALETDPDFRAKLDKADEADIRSGKIAHELEYVNHNVRTKLDEIKRQEIERLRQLATKHYELSNNLDREHLKIAEHLDHENHHTFEIEDLRKLILKTSSDLAEADRKRREEFKQYELQKEFEKNEKLQTLDEENRKKYEDELKQSHDSHNKHEKVHHPGNKAQLEEVWEKQDHMEGEDFDPKTFFMLHDVDSNGFWDEMEVKALFIKELDKVYQQGLPEDDMRERAEEMERMREHVFKETDTNHDGLISFEEFLAQTKRDEFNRDPGWDTVDNQPQFTHDEYVEFERRRHDEIQRLIAEGILPAHPNMPGGYYPNAQAPYQPHPNELPHGNAQQYPNQQQPQYHYQQPQQQQVYHNQQFQQQNQQYQQHQQANLHPNQQPPVQLNPNQVYQHVQETQKQAGMPPPQPQQQQLPPAVPNQNQQQPSPNIQQIPVQTNQQNIQPPVQKPVPQSNQPLEQNVQQVAQSQQQKPQQQQHH